MIHYIYITTHKNGKYYVGRHSTEYINDGYIGSGKWPRSIKDKSSLTTEILEYADSFNEVKLLEGKLLNKHFGKPGCMNRSKDPVGFEPGDRNPMRISAVAAKISGSNHWLKRNPERVKEISKRQKQRAGDGTLNFVGDTNPMKTPRNRKQASNRRREQNLTNNPSTVNAAKGTHHWQHGKSPNADGKLNKKLIEAGTHNFLGPEHNLRMVAEGKNPWVGSEGNLKRLAEGTHPSQQKKTCEHCGKTCSIGMHKRWHGKNCKSK